MNKHLLTLPFITLLVGANLALPNLAKAETDQPTTLPEMVVTATRTETAKNQLSAASTVYTRTDIERLQVKTLPDLLRGTTGIDITQQGGDGKISSVFMRGTNSDHVLVLVDGIKIGSATSGTSPFEFIPIDQVERVEIIRGPQSSLYGSEAIGGVIQIFTRKGADTETPKVTLDTGGGNYGTLKATGNVSGKLGKSWYNIGASHINTEGFSAQGLVPGDFGYFQPDNDRYYNTAVNARAGYRFDADTELDASFMRSQGRTDFDGTFQDKTKFINQVASITGSIKPLEDWKSTLRLGHSFDNIDQFLGKQLVSNFYTQRWNAAWLNEIDLHDDHKAVIGTDFRLDEVDNSVDIDTFSPGFQTFSKKSRYDVGVFGELHSRLFDDHFINASVRFDQNEAFGSYVTGNIGWRYNSPIGISPFANFGNAFKAPSFNDLYFPGFGNPKLGAEESTTVEVGLAGDNDWLKWEARAYHTNIDSLITLVCSPVNPSLCNVENIDKAQIDGLEAEVSTQILGWNSKLSLNYLDPKNRVNNLRLPRRYQKSLSFDLSRSYDKLDVGATVLAQGNRFDNKDNSVLVGGYVTVDLRAAYHFDKHWTLNAKLNNLLDKQYQLVNTYNTADRNFFVSIHYNN